MSHLTNVIPAIVFHIQYDAGFSNDDKIFHIDCYELKFKLQARRFDQISGDNSFILFIGEPNNDKEQSYEIASKFDKCLRIASLNFSLGIITKNINPTSRSVITDHGLKFIEQISGNTCRAMNLSDGINILPVDGQLCFPNIMMSHKSLVDVKIFFGELIDIYNKKLIIDDLHNTIIDMLNSSFYEKSPWARFIICVSAIELMSPRDEEDDATYKFFKDIEEYAVSKYPQIKEKINNKFIDIYKKSISASCRETISKYLGEDRAKEFSKIYSVRSKIAHGTFHTQTGHPDTRIVFELAKDLLMAKILPS